MAFFAQTVWDKPEIDDNQTTVTEESEKKTKANEDEKYLAGAVTETDGKVEWTLDLDVPGKDAEQIYNIMLACFNDITKSKNQLEGSTVPIVSKQDHIVVASIKEWLVFHESFISIDRTKFFYTLKADCYDNRVVVTMSRLAYKYDEENVKGGYFYKAEEWINDSNALNKKKTKILPGCAKFRRKTIDRKDELFNIIRSAVLN